MRLIDADALRDYAFEVYQGNGVELETLMVVPLGEIDNAPTYNQVGHKMAMAEGFITNPEWMKGDLISRNALKKEFGYTDEWYKGRTVCAIIDNAPAVEAISTELHEKIRDKLIRSNLRPQGKWIGKEEYDDYPNKKVCECSECGKMICISHDDFPNFCENCGAEMKVVQNETTD